MIITVDLTSKPKGYLESLQSFIDNDNLFPANGFCELGHPKILKGNIDDLMIDRVHLHYHNNACAKIMDVVIYDNKAQFSLIKIGPKKADIEDEYQWTIGARSLKDPDGTITRITAFDLVKKTDHNDYN